MYALVTGASSGIGKELSFLLAKQNYNLILVARNKDQLMDIKKELTTYNIDVVLEVLDLSILNNCYSLFDRIKIFDVGLFVNNAGFGNLGLFTKTDLDIELNLIDLNIKALHILTKLYIQHFKSGTLVNISSMASFLPTPLHATYSASKSYVYYFSRAISYELKRENIDMQVLTVVPGPVKTQFNSRARAKSSKGMDSRKCASIIMKGITKKKELIIPGLRMKIVFFFIRFVPTKWLMKIAHNIQNSK